MKKPEINPHVAHRVASSLAMQPADKVRQCCTAAVNLLPEEADDCNMTALLRCRVCGRGHRYMLAETGELGAHLNALGARAIKRT